MLRRSAVLLVLCACGGSVASTTSSSSSSSSSSGGTSSGGSSGGGSSSGSSGRDGCSTAIYPANRACVPGTAKSGTVLTLDVDATEGCLSCSTTLEPCRVAVGAGTIIVTMETRTCKGGEMNCPAVCGIAETKCTIPPLAAGTYSIVVAGESPRTGLPPRELVVADTGTETSCALAQSHLPRSMQDGTKYATNCNVDADCTSATFGNPCQPCACPTAAIATSALSAYQADRRALTSQCPSTDEEIQCAACPPPNVYCDTSTGLTGACRSGTR